MESEKYRNNSESSSEEDDQIKGDRTSKKQSYACTFCNRGFTNAQALGGHMNMHRKDRAKAKQTDSNSSIFNEEYLYPTYSPYVTSESSSSPNKYYPMNSFEDQRNYMCFQLPQAAAVYGVSRARYGCFNQQEQNSFHVTRSPVLSSDQEQHWGANLSLQVGSNNVEGLVQDNELDLELRLGNGR